MRLIDRLIMIAAPIVAAIIAALLMRPGVPPIVPPIVPVEPPAMPEPPRPPAPAPDPLAAIVRISRSGVGCSGTIIGPRRVDGRYWVLTAAHCQPQTGARWTMYLRDGRSAGMVIVNMDQRADYAWGLTDSDSTVYPYALLAERTPAVGTRVWHAGYGVHIPANREDGTVTAAPDSQGQTRYRISVSSGDSGGGIVTDSDGYVLSPVCCTTRAGAVADVWGASPEACRRGQVALASLDEWHPIPIPTRMPPER